MSGMISILLMNVIKYRAKNILKRTPAPPSSRQPTHSLSELAEAVRQQPQPVEAVYFRHSLNLVNCEVSQGRIFATEV